MFSRRTLIYLTLAGVLLVAILGYFSVGAFLAISLLDRPVVSHQNYRRIYDWDLSRHTYDIDLDGDQKNDFISLTGCAFLSNSYQQVTGQEQCIAEGISALESDAPQSGQKFIDTSATNLDLGFRSNSPDRPSYAFMYQQNNQWRIVSKNTSQTAAYLITTDGLLKTTLTIPERAQVFLYEASKYSTLGLYVISLLSAPFPDAT